MSSPASTIAVSAGATGDPATAQPLSKAPQSSETQSKGESRNRSDEEDWRFVEAVKGPEVSQSGTAVGASSIFTLAPGTPAFCDDSDSEIPASDTTTAFSAKALGPVNHFAADSEGGMPTQPSVSSAELKCHERSSDID